ncbi:MAG: hypothetical protein LC792_19145 [Actinobacteria bacterium]|nr:hypothetical protein [Actinomycetota bacterium]
MDDDYEEKLADVLADERDRLFEHAGIDEPDPDDAVERSAVLIIDGAAVTGTMRTEGSLWAARAEIDAENSGREVVVTVVSRGVPIERLELATITDLAPYLRGRRTMLARSLMSELHRRHWPRRRTRSATPEAAHRALIEHSIAQSERLREALNAGRRPRPSRQPEPKEDLWQTAVKAQMTVRHLRRADANDAVTVMINHMTSLAEKAAWFNDQPALRAAAIDDTIRFTAHDQPVASLAAQKAWVEAWSVQRSAPSLLRDLATEEDGRLTAEAAKRMHNHLDARQHAEQQWLAAWSRWADSHVNPGRG